MSIGKLLIVEDDTAISSLLVEILTNNNYSVTCAYSGTEGKLLLKQHQFDCVLLDLMLPGLDGESLIIEMRKEQTVPIIVISAKLGTDARVNALRLGADDFIPKPFEFEEVLARVEAQLRRSRTYSSTLPSGQILTWKNCVLNTNTTEITVNEVYLNFTPLELRILEMFMRNPKRVLTRSNIFENCWQQSYIGDENTVDVHISHIRNKIAKADPDTEYIKTIRGIGFRMCE
ncbi:response regulator transcription factor [Bacillus massiliigorillae]|uniref:response regulator transcription factor n=1 Tax=Bacillus massiliigorillae TaxID=1243664 RepID=UPI0003A2E609|nr:response regulator transcription factor [Bacillus massiliigorillae]